MALIRTRAYSGVVVFAHDADGLILGIAGKSQ